MSRKDEHLQLVTGGRKRMPRLSATSWINKVTKAMGSRPFPIEKFILLPPLKKEDKPAKS